MKNVRFDAVLAAGMYVGSVGIKADTSSVEVTPLYDLKETITAYYVSFSSSAHAVINNLKGNPSAKEFSEGENKWIRYILEFSSSSCIVYYNLINIWDVNNASEDDLEAMSVMPSLYESYPEVKVI